MINYITTKEAAKRKGVLVHKMQKDISNGLYPGFQVCPRSSSFLIPENLVPAPDDGSKEIEMEKILINFISKDILTDKQREKISNLKPKKQKEKYDVEPPSYQPSRFYRALDN